MLNETEGWQKRPDWGKPHCCYLDAEPPLGIPCNKPAEFSIHGVPGHFEDVTEACEDHVGSLLGTPTWMKKENTHWLVYPMESA